jgi:orotate phosphoribosyltransferase
MNHKELAEAIFKVSNLKGEFHLRSGQISNEYFDKYLFECQPEILKSIANEMSKMVPSGIDVLAGLEMGGIPIATMISHMTGIPAAFVRKKQKEYGTCKLAEGGNVENKKVLVIEDVVTSGGQIIESVKQLRNFGAIITKVLCVIDRESGGKENLKQNDLSLLPLFSMSELHAASAKLSLQQTTRAERPW